MTITAPHTAGNGQPPTAGRTTAPIRGYGGPFAVFFLVVVFAILAAVVFAKSGNPEIRRIDLVARQYADAWTKGSLDGLEYDQLSAPATERGDPDKVNDQVRAVTQALDPDPDDGQDVNPTRVEADPSTTQLDADDPNLATTRLKVTWELQTAGLSRRGHTWTYYVALRERQFEGRWRVVWTPETVHPVIRPGLVFRVQRGLAPRAPVIGAGDTALPPDSNPGLARSVLGSIANRATAVQADLAPLRAAEGDRVGVAGLQNIYDERLAGGAQITVTAAPVQPGSGIVPTQTPLFVGAPETPTPIQLTLDARTQGWAEAALRGVTGPATVVVTRPSSGDVLAVANTSPTADYGLGAQQPPGSLFGLASYLAMVRQGYGPTSQVDCRQPYTYPGEGQMFRNAQGATIDKVRLAAAIEGGCTTALARVAATVTPAQVQAAAWDLGLATPLQAQADTPGWLAVSDQLGTPAFLGRVHSDSDTDIGGNGDPEGTRAVTPVHHAQTMVGEGKVLVSALSVTRASATVATGERRAPKLITNPAPRQQDLTKPIESGFLAQLQEIMAKAVTEPGGSAHALAALPGSPVHAMAATAGYGTGRADARAAWVTGYRGDYAFTVLVPNATVTDGSRNALEVARRFLLNIP